MPVRRPRRPPPQGSRVICALAAHCDVRSLGMTGFRHSATVRSRPADRISGKVVACLFPEGFMRITVDHNTTKEEARRKVEQKLGALLGQFSHHADDLEHEWYGDVLRF